MALKLAYYFRHSDRSESPETHDRICGILSDFRRAGRVVEAVVADQESAFPTEADRQRLLDTLRDFAMRHQVGLRRAFGSRREGFWYLPPHFLLVRDGDELREVFPCNVGGQDIDVLDFLERLARGEAWTTRSATWREGGRHRQLVDRLVNDPSGLEPGLVLQGLNVPVSQGFGERGLIDVVFRRADGGYLLVEVKGKPEELDKAIGQILRHRRLFAAQNRLSEGQVAMAIACAFIPAEARQICEAIGIRCLELSFAA